MSHSGKMMDTVLENLKIYTHDLDGAKTSTAIRKLRERIEEDPEELLKFLALHLPGIIEYLEEIPEGEESILDIFPGYSMESGLTFTYRLVSYIHAHIYKKHFR